jgi:hypothetical protein
MYMSIHLPSLPWGLTSFTRVTIFVTLPLPTLLLGKDKLQTSVHMLRFVVAYINLHSYASEDCSANMLNLSRANNLVAFKIFAVYALANNS